MKRFFLLVAMLFAPALCWGQQTTVQATVLDPTGRAYSFLTGTASINCPGNQAPLFNGYSIPRTISITGGDGNGHFQMVLYDINSITPVGCSYNFAITWQDAITTFIAPGIGASGSATPITGTGPVNLSTPINAYAVLLPPSAGGVASIFATAPIVVTPSPILSTGTISCPTCFTGAIANTQIAVGTGASIAGSANFTWSGSILFINNPTLATAILNQNSPSVCVQGNIWNGSASVTDEYCIQNVLTGVSGNLTITHTATVGTIPGQLTAPPILSLGLGGAGNGTSRIVFNGNGSGQLSVAVPSNAGSPHELDLPTADPTATGQYMEVFAAPGSSTNLGYFTAFSECGTVAANGVCSNAVAVAPHCVSGIATLSGGTSTITGLSPAFNSGSTYFIVTNDVTTIANPSKGVPASGSSITFTGTGTDNIQFIACGG